MTRALIDDYARRCVCDEPELGVVDGDRGKVYCEKCDGFMADVEDVIIDNNSNKGALC